MPFEPESWHWWAFALVLLITELLAPGMFFLWMAESACLVGAALWLFPRMAIETQLILFSLMSIASIVVYRRYLDRHPILSDRPLLNRRADQYIGRVFTLQQPIIDGRGTIRVDDSTWRVEGEDAAAGGKVRVVAAEGVVLRVERAG